MSTSLLSTKTLSSQQRQPLIQAGLSLEMYDALQIEYIDFKIDKNIKNTIFTSQNAVRAVHKKLMAKGMAPTQLGNCFCVGEKTKRILENLGCKVVATAKNASLLAETIGKDHQNQEFTFFSGTIRRLELPKILVKSGINFKEIVTYRTILNPQKFHSVYDGVLFFSPSGVESYFQQNNLTQGTAFCIGETTAMAVKKYVSKSKTAAEPSIESVVQCVLNHYNLKCNRT